MNGKICVVTGATSGIGWATAIGLAQLGARVVVVARNPVEASSVIAEIAAISGAAKAEIVVADLSAQKLFLSPEKGALTSIFLASDPSVAGVTGAAQAGIWVITGVFLLGAIPNLIFRSMPERYVMAPLSLLL